MFLFLCFTICAAILTSDAKSETRIIGGTDAPAGRFPFAVAIYVHTAEGRYFCGGALLNQQWVITSGSCVYNAEQFTIQLGSNTLTLDDPDRQILSSSEYVSHPDFDPETIQNDIGLIKLRLPISYNSYVQPINVPTINLTDDISVTALGWGQVSDFDPELSEHLQFVQASVLSNVECRGIYGNQITENMACVIGNFNEGTCTGDNGGPLVEYFNRHYWIVGVASFISGNGCESTDPSGYTRTFAYTDWINNVTRS